MGTRVVNLKTDEYDIRIDRTSKWGNPFRMRDQSDKERKRVIEAYREWILRQDALLASLWELRDKRLGCHCSPKPCHGDVLAELVELTDGAEA